MSAVPLWARASRPHSCPGAPASCRHSRASGKVLLDRWLLLVLALPVVLAAVCWAAFPFAAELSSRRLSLTELSAAQKSNIQLAARAIDGAVIRPGETFSFNAAAGPRTSGRSYRLAPSYLGAENLATMGGGICLLSSALYQVALESGCRIVERVPHLRTIKTVPPGLDATVWYGQADLKFQNTLGCPLQVAARADEQTLSVALLGRRDGPGKPVELQRFERRPSAGELVAEVVRREGTTPVLVSRDLYTILK
jgi:vancomycin resistance protein VanW